MKNTCNFIIIFFCFFFLNGYSQSIEYTWVQPTCVSPSNGELHVTITGHDAAKQFMVLNTDDNSVTSSPITLNNSYTFYNLKSNVLYFAYVSDIATGETFKDVSPYFLTPIPYTVSVQKIKNAGCESQCVGIVTAQVDGGVPPYTYIWDDQKSGTYPSLQTITNACVNEYSVSVIDDIGCQITSSSSVSVESAEVVASVLVNQHVVCKGQPTGEAVATASNTTGIVTYTWSDGFVGMKHTNLYAGNHYVVAKDGLGCFDTAFFTITEPAEKLELIVDSLLPVRCKGMSIGEAYLSSKHGAAPISYEWSDGYLELSRVNLPAQTYEVTATDDMGCTDVISFAITEPLDGMEGEVSTFTPPLCFGDKNGKATLSVVGGTPPYTVLWDDAFDNDSTSTDFVRSDLEKRLYSITFFDAEACEYSLSFNMPEPEILTAQILAPDNSPAKISVLCSEDCNINVKVFPEGGTAPYSYAWNNGLPNSQAVQLCANTYEVVVTDANGCSTNASHTVTAPPLLENILEIRSPIQCFGETGEIHSVSVGGTTPYSYAWSNGSTAIKTGKVIAGTYKLTLTDANGCKKVESLLLPQPDTLQLHITIDNLVCQNVADGSLTVAETGGTAPFSYLWSTAESTATIHDLSAQLYHVTVTDNNACVAHDTIDLTNINQFGVIFSSLPVTCEGRSDGEITASAFVGTPPFTYEWHDAVTDSARKNLPVGMYSVTITDALGCTVTDSLNLSIIPPMFVAHSGTTETPCNEAYGSAYITIDGGTKPYSYLWSNAATTDSVGNLPVGSYTVDVTDANACVFSHNFFVDDTSTFAIEVISPDTRIRCENANTGIAIAQPQRGTPPYTFLWSTLETSDTLKNVGAGLYRLTAWDAYFCSAKDSIRFEEFNVLTSTIIDSGMVSCNGNNDGYAVLNVQGGVPPYSILWSNGATDYLNANLSPGTYTCTVTDNAGCVSTNKIIITEPEAITALISNAQGVSCGNVCDGKATISVSGGTTPYAYMWTSGETVAIAKALCGGKNYVTIQDARGCVYIDSVAIVDTMPRIGLTAFEIQPACGIADGELAVVPFGGVGTYSFLWSTGATDSLIQNVLADVYTIKITDKAGCALDTILMLNDNSTMTLDFVRQPITYCTPCNESFVVSVSNATAPYQYNWSNGDDTQLADSLCPGLYTVTVQDDNSCKCSKMLEVKDVAITIDVLTKTNVPCYGDSTGVIEVVASGGVSDSYTYSWSHGEIGPLATQVPAGTIELRVSEDLSVCEEIRNYTITQASELRTFFIVDQPSYCEDSTGIMHVEVLGATAPYSFIWENGVVGKTIPNAWPEYISVTITDGNGCVVVDSAKVDDVSDFSLFEKNRHLISCIDDADGALEIGMTNGFAPFTYTWSHASTLNSPKAENIPANTYMVTVTDSKKCAVSYTFAPLTNPAPISMSIVETESIFCNNGTGSIAANVSGGHAPYVFEWLKDSVVLSSKTNAVSYVSAGMFHVIATDSRSCVSDTVSYEFNSPGPITADFTVQITGCGSISHTGSIVLDTIIGHNPPYKFRWHDETSSTTWYNGHTNVSRTGLPAGEYFFTVFDSLGLCYEVFRNYTYPTTVVSIDTVLTHTHCDFYSDDDLKNRAANGSIEITKITTQNAEYTDFSDFTFVWEDIYQQTTKKAENLPIGDYYVNIQGKNECVSRIYAGKIVSEIELNPTISSVVSADESATTICFGDSLQLQAQSFESIMSGYSPTLTNKKYTWLSTPHNTTARLSSTSDNIIWANPLTHYFSDSSRVLMYYEFDGCKSRNAQFSISHFDSIGFSLHMFDNSGLFLQGDSVFVFLEDFVTIEPSQVPWFLSKNPLEDGYVSIQWESANTTKTGRGQIQDTITNENSYNASGMYGLNIQALVSSYYYAHATTTNQCIESDSVFVHVFSDVFVPSGITPNGDGENDVWIIPYLYSCPNASVKVYTRWGTKVYQNEDVYYKNPWNGANKKGELLPMGTYYYIIEYNDQKNTPPKAGAISILY